MLVSKDNSLWQIDYPNLDTLEQLTPVMPISTDPADGRNMSVSLIGNVSWSADGDSLAFVGGTDIYIIDMRARP